MKWIATFIVICALLTTSLLALKYLSLMRPLPEPTGLYGIGVEIIHVTSPTRNREWQAHIWYPTDMPKRRAYSYGDVRSLSYSLREMTHSAGYAVRMLGWINTYINSWTVKTFSNPHSTISNKKAAFPVIFFSPGFGALPDLYHSILENLASHGFIVVAINHPDMNGAIVWPDGHISHHDASPDSDVQWQKAITRAAGDVQETAQFLEVLARDTKSMWYQRLTLSQFGACGHSFGSMIPVMLCRTDKRCIAGVNLDGWLGDRQPKPIDKSFLFLMNDSNFPSKEFYAENKRDIEKVCSFNSDKCLVTIIPISDHFSFSDLSLLRWPLSTTLPVQREHPYVTLSAINRKLSDFFKAVL